MNYNRIQKLSPLLANQIAAGEVIERPASVLKEVLENSLDAGSTEIEIIVEQGGIERIQVTDNGSGICKEDLELALLQHATSKILTLSDLEGVTSFGFRGEALASISAVSRVTLHSCIEGEKSGWSIKKSGRHDPTVNLQPIARSRGTTIIVEDLFYNTPVRKKFLRSQKTELLYLEELFKRVALSKPEVAFSWNSGDKNQKKLTACRSFEAEKKRIAALCGEKFIQDASFIESEANGLKLRGFLGSPKTQRAQPDLQFFYVNGRIVRDKVVMHAVKQAYHPYCIPGKYPAYILYFELDPNAVDVNVHPTKHEVRFREAKTVHAFLSYCLQEGLAQKEINSTRLHQQENTELKEISSVYSRQEIPRTEVLDANEQNYSANSIVDRHSRVQNCRTAILDAKHPQGERQGWRESPGNPEVVTNEKNNAESIKPLCILHNEILLSETNDKLTLFDIKTAQKILYRKQLENMIYAEGIAQKPLLFPISIKLLENFKNLEEKQLDLKKLGFDFSVIGPNTILLRAIPALFGSKVENLENLIQSLFKLKRVEDYLDETVNYIIKSQSITLENVHKLMDELQKYNIVKEFSQKLYRQINLEQLRAALFS